jgi:uncharacterized membrane protein YfbV (UPF0208 family)
VHTAPSAHGELLVGRLLPAERRMRHVVGAAVLAVVFVAVLAVVSSVVLAVVSSVVLAVVLVAVLAVVSSVVLAVVFVVGSRHVSPLDVRNCAKRHR